MVLNSRFFIKNTPIDPIDSFLFQGENFKFDIARFDLIDPHISGNKLFKLYYQLLNVRSENKSGILTMGGAYSNHLHATAALCQEQQIACAAIIRGEESLETNSTLKDCCEKGMQLHFVSRESYKNKDRQFLQIVDKYPDFLFVPSGGDNEDGEKGAALMPLCIPQWESYTSIVCAAGTGTTARGIQQKLLPHQHLWIIPALKIEPAEQENYFISCLSKEANLSENVAIQYDAAGKGFGKKEDELFILMNEFYRQTRIPTDFVYTAKTLRGLLTIIRKQKNETTQKYLMIHTGGLQGNRSLKENTLVF
jgi:1-aminocyclopropane-1-carboxylate deaminase/D-cysteine desulfhydrase-like pyridoxal-dependent ACC family enzyme